MSEQTNAARVRELNATIRYTMWSVFRAQAPLPALRDELAGEVDGHRIKAATFSFQKWNWVARAGRSTAGSGRDVAVLRCSVGRHREESVLQVPDDELVAASLRDLSEATGLSAVPVDSHVQRWGGGLPQYAVGHLARVARVRADVARVRGLAVCGAAYEGVGIPAVVASAQRAVSHLAQAQ
jgi:oxygen-dependent protoporphyrinogen oxidase